MKPLYAQTFLLPGSHVLALLTVLAFGRDAAWSQTYLRPTYSSPIGHFPG